MGKVFMPGVLFKDGGIFPCKRILSVYAYTVHNTHTTQVILCRHNTDVCIYIEPRL